MVLLEFSMAPLEKGTSVGGYVNPAGLSSAEIDAAGKERTLAGESIAVCFERSAQYRRPVHPKAAGVIADTFNRKDRPEEQAGAEAHGPTKSAEADHTGTGTVA